MLLIVETGEGLSTANSYVSVEEATGYFRSHGRLAWEDPSRTDDQRGAALVRATAYLDAVYGPSFSGQRRQRRAQALEWPRVNAAVGTDPLPHDELPRELRVATCEAAFREFFRPGALSPDLRGSSVTSVSAGSVSVSFGAGGHDGTQRFQQVELAVRQLLGPRVMFSGSSGRG